MRWKLNLIGEAVLLPRGLRISPETRSLRSILAIDEREGVIQFAQTTVGKFVLMVVFAVILAMTMTSLSRVAVIVSSAAAYAYFPKYRVLTLISSTFVVLFASQRMWFSLEGVSAIMLQENIGDMSVYTLNSIVLIGFFICAGGVLEFARRHTTWFIVRRPLVTLLTTLVLLCGLVCSPFIHGLTRVLLWSVLMVFSSYIWFLAYAIVDQRLRDRSPHLFQLGTFQPFWSQWEGRLIPFGKGAAFLRKTQSKNPRDLAITQIKAIKLLIWSIVLLQLSKLLIWIFQTTLQIPTLELVQAAFYSHQPYSILISWESLILETALTTLRLAIAGHQIIAMARLAGFRLPRNTWRPLESRTLADFWNRYYYYFKELLVEFFFLPTFLRVFQNHPRLRMFFATFMAAGVGNAIYHFFRDIHLVATMGLWGYIQAYSSYFFYCVVLATGISISQARAVGGFKPAATFFGRLYSFLCIWTFIVCLHVFANESYIYTLKERLFFMATLFGVN